MQIKSQDEPVDISDAYSLFLYAVNHPLQGTTTLGGYALSSIILIC